MTLALYTESDATELAILTISPSIEDRKKRILGAIGNDRDDPPLVEANTLFRYFEFLSKNLSFSFTAHYPEPTTPLENDQFECTVLELLDPSKFVGDQFDGILCKTRKAGLEVNLPLIELEISEDNLQVQMVEDYCYWFWNWR